MTDLVSQYKRLKGEIDSAIGEVLDSAAFINGPQVKRFASQLQTYTGIKHVVPCANGTDALQIALMSLDIPAGSEIITPGFSYVAVSEVCALLKLRPVFVDVDPDTFNIDVHQIEAVIGPRTKAIVPVHLFGQCADMAPIMKMAEKHGLFVIEDNAQSIGAWYLNEDGTKSISGSIGNVSTLSFFPSKNLGCYGDGGALCTNDSKVAEKAGMIANHGQRVKYHHELVGVNSRLDTVQASILSVKLRHLDEFTEARQAVAEHYNRELSGVEGLQIPMVSQTSTHVYHQYTLKVLNGRRDELKALLAEKGIPTTVHYPVAVHQQAAYLEDKHLPVSEMLTEQVLSLPMGTDMDTDQLNYITQTIKEQIKQ